MNHTENLTVSLDDGEIDGNDDIEEVNDVTKIGIIGGYVIILLFSFVGNSVIIHLVRTRTNIRKNPFNWLLFNTAIADLLDVITASAFSVPFILCGDCWISGMAGTILCKLIPFFLVVSICVSIWTLTVIAADRYLAIVCIRRRPLSSRSVVCSIMAVWLFAGLIFSGELYKFKVDKEDGEAAVCYPEWHVESEEISIIFYQTEMIVKVIITYAVPLVIMAVLYSLIAYFLWKQRPPGAVNQEACVRQMRKRRAVIKMLITAVVVFALCWLPAHVSHIMSEFYTDSYFTIPLSLRLLFYWLAHANAAIHPWLFIAFSENLRGETKAIFHNIRKRGLLKRPKLSTSSQPSLFTHLELAGSREISRSRSSVNISTLSFDTKF
ncbi:substance-K receptor-like [Oculina patagonica]